jgi:hypothetical protein
MPVTMNREAEEVSLINREKSRQCVERSSMTAEADVNEMQTLCGELAERLAPSGSVKARVNALMGKLKLGENRVVEFLRGKARRVDSWEKDHARRVLEDLRRAERQQRELEHLTWLEAEIGRHRASGSAFRGAHVDGLEHFLRLARGADSAVEVVEGEDANT